MHGEGERKEQERSRRSGRKGPESNEGGRAMNEGGRGRVGGDSGVGEFATFQLTWISNRNRWS
jgi:hypothetical protein